MSDPLPFQGLIALKVALTWAIALVLLVVSFTLPERKHVPDDLDDH